MKPGCDCEKAFGIATLRWSVGLLFFIAGLNKFMGEGGPAAAGAGIASGFTSTWLPMFMVKPFAYVTPYAELILGALLILGLARRFVAPLSALFMLALTFGVMLLPDMKDTVFKNMVYTFLFAVTTAAGPWDKLTLDHLLFGRKKEPLGFTNT